MLAITVKMRLFFLPKFSFLRVPVSIGIVCSLLTVCSDTKDLKYQLLQSPVGVKSYFELNNQKSKQNPKTDQKHETKKKKCFLPRTF